MKNFILKHKIAITVFVLIFVFGFGWWVWATTVGTDINISGSLKMAGTEIITSGRALQNITAATMSGNLNMNNNNISGVNKITVATIDPIYNIRGQRYATYAPFMVGTVKEEVTGTIQLINSQTIDFDNLQQGSELWLFTQITDFGPVMENLQVFLTPGFEGRAWYKKNPLENTLTIYGDESGEVSFRLIASRFDHKKWGILADPEDPSEGMRVDD